MPVGLVTGDPSVSWGPESGILVRPLVLPFTSCKVISLLLGAGLQAWDLPYFSWKGLG